MQVLFAARPAIGSWLIRFFTWSPFSHAAVIDGNKVIHSTWPKGVHEIDLWDFIEQYPTVEVVNINLPDEKKAMEWCRSQIGKPYDTSFILGFIFRMDDWEKDDAWVCNELIEAAAVVGGKRRIRGSIGRVSPQISYMVSVDD